MDKIKRTIKKSTNASQQAILEMVSQAFPLLGFFIIWLTLTGSARDVVGVAIIVTVLIRLITIPWRRD